MSGILGVFRGPYFPSITFSQGAIIIIISSNIQYFFERILNNLVFIIIIIGYGNNLLALIFVKSIKTFKKNATLRIPTNFYNTIFTKCIVIVQKNYN